MFKLESYITPIILNHVAKYVKNIRPEDSQVSLWEGEVAFQNLDLRLDVLEEELNLPFEFLSGHVHELSIQVPWMKITSEPIKITINTIEFVLKLKDTKSDASPSPKKMEKKKRVSKVEDGSQPQGYMPGLVNKVINNIVINCHNIILKYVEEDIVVSMNIQLLSFSSADEDWKPAFTDIHPLRVFMRKLVQVSDLTICLDKRNAAGQIDVCQEPILYRCSLEVRIVRKYNANTIHIGSTTKIAIFTKLMEMNVSSLQFPMAMRLFKLLLALKAGELKSKSTADVNDEDNDPQEGAANAPSSYLAWAWNLIPTFGLSEPEEEAKIEDDTSGQLFEMGIYVEALNFTLKSSEFITDSIVGATKKIRYSPIVKLILGGIYSETVIVSENNWSNTKCGCSSMCIEPLGAYKDDESEESSLVTTAALTKRTFLDRSLFDSTFIEKDWTITSIDEYNVRVTEDYLLYRSPVIALDIVEYKDVSDNDISTTEAEENINRTRVVYRILASSMTLRYNQTYSRIAAVLKELIHTYDYPPYSEEKPETVGGSPKLHPPLLDDFDSLMIGIPLRVYKFNFSTINLELHPKSEPLSTKSSRKLSVSPKKSLPYLQLWIFNIEGQWSTPLDPDKLVHTTCQLPDKPIELLNACYENAQIRFKTVGLDLKHRTGESTNLLSAPKGSINFGDLLQPSLWQNEEVPLRKLDISMETIILEFSKSELILALRLVNLISEFDERRFRQISQHAAAKEELHIRLRSQFTRMNMEIRKFIQTTMYRGSLKLLQSHLMRPKETENDAAESKITFLTTTGGGERNKWLEWYAQIPTNFNDVCTRSVLALWMEEYHLHVNENVMDFLKFMEPQVLASKEPTPEVIPTTTSRAQMARQSSKKSLTSDRQPRRTGYPEETIHVSSERDEKATIETNREKDLKEQISYRKMLPYIKSIAARIQIAKGNIHVTSGKKKLSSNSDSTQILLPRIIFSTATAENITRFNVQTEYKTQIANQCKDTFPWTCSISDFGVQSSLRKVTQFVIHPIQTSITIAMTHKKETVGLAKVEKQQQQQPKVAEENEAEKSKQGQLPMTLPPSAESSCISMDMHRKRIAGGSVSPYGRSVSYEEPDRMSNGSGRSEKSGKSKSLLQEAVDIMFSGRRKSDIIKDVVSISLHVDTSPINVEFDSKRTQLIRKHLSLLSKTVALLQKSEDKITAREKDTIQIITSAEENPNIKQFLDIDTNSDSSKLSTIERSTSNFVASILLQWTITKFTIELDASEVSKCKLVVDMEDLISSVDKREDFTKFTCKIGTFNMRFFEVDAANTSVLSDRLRIKMQTDSTQSPLFNMIITTVGVKNFFQKIGAKRKDADLCRAISEVIVRMEAIEMIVDMDKVAVLAPAIIALTGPKTENKEIEAPATVDIVHPCTVCELPMVHLDSKGFTIYMPTESKKAWCSVLILKLGSIRVSPNLENPLQRNPVRADVFQKAAQMGILSTPGSVIEDRQYEASLNNISVATGNWNEILAHMREHTDNFHNTNPAFEWNNQGRKTSLELRKIFSNFTFITTFAPCITCNNVLICGQAIEFNCSNDLVASLTTDQLNLITCIISKTEKMPKTQCQSQEEYIAETKPVYSKPKKSKSQPALKTHFVQLPGEGKSSVSFHSLETFSDANKRTGEDSSEQPVTDSGISLDKRSLNKRTLGDNSSGNLQLNVRQIPHTISFVAGIFSINLFDYQRTVTGIPQGDEPKIVETLTPLISVNLSQPSFLISQSIYEITKRFSLFNCTVNLHHPPDPSLDDFTLADEPEPPEIIFNTKVGEVGSSGIPPPLFVIKSHTTRSKKLEIDVTFSKPATIRLTEKSLQSLTKHVLLYYQTLLEHPCFNIQAEKLITRATKIGKMRNIFFEAERFTLKTDMISIKFSEARKYKVKISLVDLRLSTRFLSRPEKMNAKGSIGGLYVKLNDKVVAHPIGVKCNADFVQESWNRLPLVTVNVKFNVLQFDIGVEVVSSYSDATKAFNNSLEIANNMWEDFLRRRSSSAPEINRDNLQAIRLPEVERKSPAEPKEEFYQDDLRAGAFQFVEMISDSFLPMPYQIQIIKKNYGIICWRYPQPRMMSKIHISPVPMAVPNPIRIKCRMEYFSDAHEGFLHFCDFWLSETVSKSIELPNREVTANIWRVVILQSLVSINRECFDTSEEDEELRSIISIGIDDILNAAKKESDFILHPKVLVGCMRIDTVFRPSAIPKFQILLNINDIQINLQNHQNMLSKPPPHLQRFRIAESTRLINQTFLSLNVEKTSIHASFHTPSNYSIHSEATIGIKCLDYGYLNLIYLVEQTNVSAYLRVNGAIGTNIMADKLRLNLGPSILHNLSFAKRNWEIYFKDAKARKSFIISKFVVANRTHTNIQFGQSGTGERILLQTRECCKYSFQSEYFDQALTFYVNDGQKEHKSESVVITLDFPASSDSIISPVLIDDRCLIIRTRRVSAAQYYILIKGQIELISMVKDSFLMEFYQNKQETDNNEVRVEPKGKETFLHYVTEDSNICIRLKMDGPREKGQTGNIPLKSNKNYPWLVKVPVSGSEKFVSYWVRIIRESIEELRTETYHPQRILISIWPIFEIQSMMTCEMTAIESSTNAEFVLPPEGNGYPLCVPATHQTDHRISFVNDFQSAPNFNLTLKAIDWNKFFWYDENVWTVEKTLAELCKPVHSKWPMNDEEELRMRRKCTDSTKTSLLYKCFPSREFSCTLSLEVAPWGTFINSTGQSIQVQNSHTNETVEVPSGFISMLPVIKSEFKIGIASTSSLPIVFDKSIDTSKRKCYRLNENESADIVILRGEQIFKFHMEFRTENERNIFVLKPKYVIANMSKHLISVLPFSLDHKETITRKDITELGANKNVAVQGATTLEYSVGICLDGFYDSNGNTIMRSTDSAFIYFICVKIDKSEISIPIALMHPFNRKCFSLQYGKSSVPLSASLLEKDGQFFISIFDDTSPMMLLNNQTDLTFIVAQTKTPENNKVSNTVPEYDGRHFEWYQLSRPRSLVYYTPPTLFANFPDVEPSVCNLSIALYNENNHNKKNIKWSKSIQTDASWEKFLHVPGHGDVKMIVCDKHRIIRLSIFYIAQQLEFSVKDLRSRLLTPQLNDSPENTATSTQVDAAAAVDDEPLQRVKPTISSECIHQSTTASSVTNTPLKINLSVNEINVSIFVECKTVDFLKKEIFALYVDDFLLTYDNAKRKLIMQLTNLQIDNQLFSSGNYDFPVVLCSQELYKRSPTPPSMFFQKRCNEEFKPVPMAEITAVFYNDEVKIRSIGCRVSPIRAYIEDTYLTDLLDYLVECSPSNVAPSSNYEDYHVHLLPGEFLVPKDIVAQALYISEPLRMQQFRVDSMSVMLSVHTCVRLYIALDHSPLEFSTYERRDILTLPLRFGHTLGMHYLSGALFGAGWVVGSLEMLGSPSGLARSFSVGLKDFVSMPVQGLLRGPWGFVVGVTQGSASLLRNITAGTVNSVSKLAASVSRNLDRLTLDPEHIQRTEALRRCRPQGFTEGFTQGITGLGISILGAVGGIARHTLEARSPTEVVTGMGKGIVGALTKPISGAAELLALTGQGVLHTVGFNAMPLQRLPSVPRNIAAHASEQKVWNLLRCILPTVLEGDQILFHHEVTLLVDGKYRSGAVFLTSKILALFETESNNFPFIHPADRLDVLVSANDKTLLSISARKHQNEVEEGTLYTTQRIMSFLQTSDQPKGMSITSESLNDILFNESHHKSRSFYISEHLGQYLIEYIRIGNLNKT